MSNSTVNTGEPTAAHRDSHRSHTAARRGPAGTTAIGRAGWVVLLAISIVGVLNHLLAVFTFATVGEEQQMFALFAGINAYAIAVLASPYRQLKGWAWLITWLEVIAFASVFPLTGGVVGRGYLVVAVIAGLAQMATLPNFWAQLARRRHHISGKPLTGRHLSEPARPIRGPLGPRRCPPE